jgi:large conductance mechanosensitive channel
MAKEKKKGFFAEFKEFIAKGNVLDMAIGVIIGAAFKAIVTSLVDNIINPLIGLVLNTSSLEEAVVILKAEVLNTAGEVETPAVLLKYGSFVKSIIDFLIVAFCLFCTLKVVMGIKNRAEALRKKEEEEAAAAEAEKPAEPTPDEVTASTLKEILAVLKESNEKK